MYICIIQKQRDKIKPKKSLMNLAKENPSCTLSLKQQYVKKKKKVSQKENLTVLSQKQNVPLM